MDKKDLIYGFGAICIILIIALVIKPAMTGQPVNTGIPVSTTSPPVIVTKAANATEVTPVIIATPPLTPSPSPTPVPTWNTSVQGIQFVDPSTYGIALNESLPSGTRIDYIPSNTSMTSYAKINGKYSGTTQAFNIPFPYWELVYTVEPVPAIQPGKIQVTPTKGEGLAYSGLQGSYSSATSEFSLQVMDGSDPNRIVRTITPPGGIDLNLWTGIKKTVTADYSNLPTNLQKSTSSDIKTSDPRPWTEKFYEGQRSYYFIIRTQSLESYTIEIKVPTKYIGKY